MKLHEFFADGTKRTVGAMARKANGRATYEDLMDGNGYDVKAGCYHPGNCVAEVSHPEAVCFCLVGGLYRLYPKEQVPDLIERIRLWAQKNHPQTATAIAFGDIADQETIQRCLVELDI